MSSTCGNCDCADKSQCVKKANQYGVVIVGTESYETEAMEFSAAAEHNGKCKLQSRDRYFSVFVGASKGASGRHNATLSFRIREELGRDVRRSGGGLRLGWKRDDELSLCFCGFVEFYVKIILKIVVEYFVMHWKAGCIGEQFIGWTTPGCGAKCPQEAWFLEPGGTTPRMDSMGYIRCCIVNDQAASIAYKLLSGSATAGTSGLARSGINEPFTCLELLSGCATVRYYYPSKCVGENPLSSMANRIYNSIYSSIGLLVSIVKVYDHFVLRDTQSGQSKLAGGEFPAKPKAYSVQDRRFEKAGDQTVHIPSLRGLVNRRARSVANAWLTAAVMIARRRRPMIPIIGAV
ncbi:hypothetical protein KFK09_003482 [Dendrobium nobile]|uniref:Uncharacterized protein n=1 Tax=Dendrobium nobile TaxID=94219 RepID=A0A8T3C3K8_DENNO|nr:hypothetical protein KFK09_003482 [Dendrobium nobile]